MEDNNNPLRNGHNENNLPDPDYNNYHQVPLNLSVGGRQQEATSRSSRNPNHVFPGPSSWAHQQGAFRNVNQVQLANPPAAPTQGTSRNPYPGPTAGAGWALAPQLGPSGNASVNFAQAAAWEPQPGAYFQQVYVAVPAWIPQQATTSNSSNFMPPPAAPGVAQQGISRNANNHFLPPVVSWVRPHGTLRGLNVAPGPGPAVPPQVPVSLPGQNGIEGLNPNQIQIVLSEDEAMLDVRMKLVEAAETLSGNARTFLSVKRMIEGVANITRLYDTYIPNWRTLPFSGELLESIRTMERLEFELFGLRDSMLTMEYALHLTFSHFIHTSMQQEEERRQQMGLNPGGNRVLPIQDTLPAELTDSRIAEKVAATGRLMEAVQRWGTGA